MNKITFHHAALAALLFCCLAARAQKPEDSIIRDFADDMNHIFENLDKDSIPHGLLLDYGMEYTDITGYNGALTDKPDNRI